MLGGHFAINWGGKLIKKIKREGDVAMIRDGHRLAKQCSNQLIAGVGGGGV